jgi:uncharacterized RDD family membrane protein YckC
MVDSIDKVMGNRMLKDHWFRRAVAYIIDSLIIFFVTVVLLILVVAIVISLTLGGAVYGNPMAGLAAGILILFIFVLIIFAFSIAYWVYFDAKGGTPGKRFMKLKPMAISGKMDYPKALIRNLSKIVGGFIGSWAGNIAGGLLMGIAVEWLIVGLDAYMGISKGEDPRRKFTDFMAGTTVVRTDVTEDFGPPWESTPPPIPGGLTGYQTPTAQVAPERTVPMPTSTSPSMNITTEPRISLKDLRDRFLLGEISEDDYWTERKKLTDVS